MASFDPRRLSGKKKGLPPLKLEDFSSLDDLDSSSKEQSLVSNPVSYIASQDDILPEDPFIEGFVPPYHPPLTNPLRPMLV